MSPLVLTLSAEVCARHSRRRPPVTAAAHAAATDVTAPVAALTAADAAALAAAPAAALAAALAGLAAALAATLSRRTRRRRRCRRRRRRRRSDEGGAPREAEGVDDGGRLGADLHGTDRPPKEFEREEQRLKYEALEAAREAELATAAER